ncbi:MAG: energy transducer TonB [Verrucomicrobiaceae bacterium]|nr:energy transducer TonB [Verrucomicrobiaceae bacterium]
MPSVRPQPEAPATAYQPQQERTRLSGSISNRGISAVNAVGTPLGRYEKLLKDAIGSRWYYYVEKQRDLVSIGTAHVRFWIDRDGRVKNLQLVENTSNEAFANVCLQSVAEIQLSPIPDDVAAALPADGLEVTEISFTIFGN